MVEQVVTWSFVLVRSVDLVVSEDENKIGISRERAGKVKNNEPEWDDCH